MVFGTAFIALPAADFEESCRFYGGVLNLPRGEVMERGLRSVDFDTGNLTIRIYEWKEAFNRGGHSGILMNVESIEDAHRRLQEAGIEVTEIRVERWGGTVCTFADPDGNRLDFLQMDAGSSD